MTHFHSIYYKKKNWLIMDPGVKHFKLFLLCCKAKLIASYAIYKYNLYLRIVVTS